VDESERSFRKANRTGLCVVEIAGCIVCAIMQHATSTHAGVEECRVVSERLMRGVDSGQIGIESYHGTRMSKFNLVGVHLVVEQLHAPDQYMLLRNGSMLHA